MKILILEDEPAAARMLRRTLLEVAGCDIESVSIEHSLVGGEARLWDRQVDLVMLDLELAGHDGFDILKESAAGAFQTIVVSAYPERAIQAFEYGVLDFVAKPYDAARIRAAIDRYRRGKWCAAAKFLAVPVNERIVVIPMEDIMYFEASGRSVLVHRRGGEVFRCARKMRDLAGMLPPHFIRLHRSFIANEADLAEIIVHPNKKYGVRLSGGGTLPLSRECYRSLRDRIV